MQHIMATQAPTDMSAPTQAPVAHTTQDGDRLLAGDPQLVFSLATIRSGLRWYDGSLAVLLGVDDEHDEVHVTGEGSALPTIVRAIELLEQVRDELREAGLE